LILTVAPALRELLEPSQHSRIPVYAGSVIAITLLGWGIGGLIGGIVADYVGRKRMMIYAIIAYSVTTGLSALANDCTPSPRCDSSSASRSARNGRPAHRSWPSMADARARKGAGLMQCGLGIGFFIASLVWLFVSAIGPGAGATCS